MSNQAASAPSAPSLLERTRWGKSRRIVRRIVVEGELELLTPTHLGNGDDSVLTDIPLLLDPLEGRAMLTGTSLAGALRGYLRSREAGFRQEERQGGLAQLLFGFAKGQNGEQSLLITSDALSAGRPAAELRDGVALDPSTRTAEDKKKYDMQLLEAGTRFPLRLELLVVQGEEERLRLALATALEGLEDGTIRLGTRKHRGFGQCAVTQWRVREYDLTKPQGLIAWLAGDPSAYPPTTVGEGKPIAELLNAATSALNACESLSLHATFRLAGSLLIRAGGIDPQAPDMIHLHSRRDGRPVPVLSGTSVAGALRARALRIARTAGEAQAAEKFANDVFGKRIERHTDKPVASRLWVDETEVRSPLELVVQRVKIDRFTGGSFSTALFSQQPIYDGGGTEVDVTVAVQNPSDADVGLLLLLLKDLWTEDLPLGGEASVGRGRLAGQCATLERRNGRLVVQQWRIGSEQDGALSVAKDGRALSAAEARTELQPFVDAFVTAVGGTAAKEATGGPTSDR